jgi:hypothetical protein
LIVRTVFRVLWAATAFLLAVAVAVSVLFALGALWVGDELRAAAPYDPMLRHGAAPVFGMVLFATTVTPALTVLPAAIAAIVGEALRLRSCSPAAPRLPRSPCSFRRRPRRYPLGPPANI